MSDKEVLSIQSIMQADDLATEEVDVPEWGGVIVIRELTKAQMNDLRRSITGDTIDQDAFEKDMFLAAVIQPEFSPEQYSLLLQKSNKVMARIMEHIMVMSRVGGDEEAEDKEVASFRS
jgi:hypothetical protein